MYNHECMICGEESFIKSGDTWYCSECYIKMEHSCPIAKELKNIPPQVPPVQRHRETKTEIFQGYLTGVCCECSQVVKVAHYRLMGKDSYNCVVHTAFGILCEGTASEPRDFISGGKEL